MVIKIEPIMQVQQNRQDALTNVDEPKTSLKKINIYAGVAPTGQFANLCRALAKFYPPFFLSGRMMKCMQEKVKCIFTI